MLACKLDVQIGVNAPLTVLSALLAVFFTWGALGSELMWDRYMRYQRRRARGGRRTRKTKHRFRDFDHTPMSTPLISTTLHDVQDEGEDDEDGYFEQHDLDHGAHFQNRLSPAAEHDRASIASDSVSPGTTVLLKPASNGNQENPTTPRGLSSDGISSASKAWLASGKSNGSAKPSHYPEANNQSNATTLAPGSESGTEDDHTRGSSDWSSLRRESSTGGSSSGYLGLGINSAMGAMLRKGTSTSNAFVAVGKALYNGCTIKNILKGLFWSLAITSMHYVGIQGLRVPQGYYTLNPLLVLASALISWVVCVVGVILMADMETQLGQQLLFSAVATTGVAAMHFTGMYGVTFWSRQGSSEMRGYPPSLANSVVAVAGITCVVANLLLAKTATMGRDKLAEVVWTRKELWKAIAQKENAEAASQARSEFLAFASHEIRTPLHHLSGFSDLLAQQELTDEGRALLSSIQRATKTLSMITTNVLDWSKLERNAETAYRPTALDIREVCESIMTLLPNVDDEATIELFMVVSPQVPSTLFLDESYIHRILMNLISNALKFTMSGYVALSIHVVDGKLVAKVEDTGVGIDPEFLPRLFEPFEQGEVRGKSRGSGLGCAIIKELLKKMSGTIEVESRFRTEERDPNFRSGTTFTLTLPLQTTSPLRSRPAGPGKAPVAVLVQEKDSVYSEGLQASWSSFGYPTNVVNDLADLPEEANFSYYWADAEYLKNNPRQYEMLLKRQETLVLVPSACQDHLRQLPGIQNTSHMIVLQKPLIWHMFEKRIEKQLSRPANAQPTKTLRFAPEVEVVPSVEIMTTTTEDARPPLARRPSRKMVILLVEDNPINQKLGCKMMKALGYEVMTADDGQHGIDKLTEHDFAIDLILMDESMPRKSGTVATREIREMEAAGKLSRRRPIVAVTAVVNSKAQQSFKEAGADDFLAKPLSLVRLRDTLALHLAQT